MTWDMLNAYSQQDPRWFEPLDRRPAEPEFLAVHRAHVPTDWTLTQRGPWFRVEPPAADRSEQGWKLHLSGHPDDAADLLETVLPVLVAHRVRFKYLLDRRWVATTTDKRWSRGSSGKFVTIYPGTDEAFRSVAEDLVDVTRGFSGPHILTDRPVPGSRCLFYRYGGFAAITRMQADGAPSLLVRAPDGSEVPDHRLPYYTAPPWVRDPFGDLEVGTDVPTLDGGRFTITGALAFTNSGGVYLATDHTDGETVVVKEARPGVLVGRSRSDATEVLRREHRILQRLADVPGVVRARSLFTEGEHVFLAEDHITGGQVSTRAIATNPVNTGDRDPAAIRRYLTEQRRWWLQVLDVIEAAHQREVVLADLSFTNVLYRDNSGGAGGSAIAVIDLEAAMEEGVDESLGLSTPGVSSPRAREHSVVDRAGDYHALGAFMLGSVMLVNLAVGRCRALLAGFLDALATDLALPAGFTDLISDLMDPEADAAGPDPAVVRGRIMSLDLDATTPSRAKAALWLAPRPPDAVEHQALADVVARSVDTIVASASPDREQRLFPGHPFQYQTNPWSVAYGAAGVLHVLHRVGGEDPAPALQRALSTGAAWLLRADIRARTAPPGLYSGRAGVAWVLDELGHTAAARNLLSSTVEDPLLEHDHSVLHGSAGVGLACLRRWFDHRDEQALHWARQCGQRLAKAAVRGDDGHVHWPAADGGVPVGYAHGAAGIATFLLSLSLATGDAGWRQLGRDGLGHDLAQAYTFPTGLVSFPARVPPPGQQPQVLRQYWDEGTAGVATALIRYLAVVPDAGLRHTWERLRPDLTRSYAVMPQLFHGLAGLGMTLLDAAELLGDEVAAAEAWRTARGVLRFAIPTSDGVSFPGEQCMRESVDLATGSSGVLLFLHRLSRTGTGADGSENLSSGNFTIDELLAELPR